LEAVSWEPPDWFQKWSRAKVPALSPPVKLELSASTLIMAFADVVTATEVPFPAGPGTREVSSNSCSVGGTEAYTLGSPAPALIRFTNAVVMVDWVSVERIV
jgi:hypothetical protein